MFSSGKCSYVNFKYKRLTLYDSFCQVIMIKGLEVAEMGWDLPVKAQSRRAVVINSVWLRVEGEGEIRRNVLGRSDLG